MTPEGQERENENVKAPIRGRQPRKVPKGKEDGVN